MDNTKVALELLTFLSDPNDAVRQMAVENATGFSAKDSPFRKLLTAAPGTLSAPDGHGKLVGRNGRPVDSIEDLKALCKDQPMAAHPAFSTLINLADEPGVRTRIGDQEFLTFLVGYIAEPISLLADLACMLLSNLTQDDKVSGDLLNLQVKQAPFYQFVKQDDLQSLMSGMDADPSAPDFEAKKAELQERASRLAAQARQREEESKRLVPALNRLLDAFEEGAAVASNASSLEEMKARAEKAQREATNGEAPKPAIGPDGRPKVERKSNCNFLASVFANISIIPKGRSWFTLPVTQSSDSTNLALAASNSTIPAAAYPVARIMIYTEHPDLIRRGGVVSTLKNILFLKSEHKILLAPPTHVPEGKGAHVDALGSVKRPSAGLDLLPSLLIPLVKGSEVAELDMEDQESLPESCQFPSEDKEREKDPALRLMLVESFLLLCTTLYGRECLRHRGVYIVVREAHLREEDERITEAVVRLVNILKRDESAATLKDLDDDAGEAPQVTPAKRPAEAEEEEEYDPDLVIEEI